MSVMRSSLLSGLLNSLKRNISRQNSRVRLFEVGKVFNGELNNHDEREKIAAISLGAIDEENWRANNDCIDFYNVKGDLESIIGSSHENHLYSKIKVNFWGKTKNWLILGLSSVQITLSVR